MNEFIDCGPRVVRRDEHGCYVRFRGAVVRSPELEPYIGQKVHVVGCLTGESHSISEWCDPPRLHPGGWWTRAGATIAGPIESFGHEEEAPDAD